MPRRSTIDKRVVLPDPVYKSRLVTKFINNVAKDGKKSTAERLFYGALEMIEDRTGEDPVKVFKKAVENVKPQVEVKSRRVGGSTYQVPIEVSVLTVGYRQNGEIRHLLPPRPPLSLDVIYQCDAEELRQFTTAGRFGC